MRPLSLATAALCLLPVSALAQFCSVAEPLSAGVGQRPYAVTAGDLNADSFADIVTANDATDVISVLLGSAAGTFGPAQLWPAGDEPVAVRVADLEGDSDLDVFTASHASNEVTILLNDGSGAFPTSVSIAVGPAPYDLIVGDFAGNGRVDVVVACAADSTIRVLVNQGGGTFAAPVAYVSGDTPSALDDADINGDTIPDIAVLNSGEDSISVFLGVGDGTFLAPSKSPIDPTAFDMECGEIDGVNGPDVVTVHPFTDVVSVRLNDGAGGFTTGGTYGVANGGWGLTSCDLDCDGLDEVVTANLVSDDVTLFWNRGGVLDSTTVVAAGSNASFVAAVSLDPDSTPDLAVAYEGGLMVHVNTCGGCAPVGAEAPAPPMAVRLGSPAPNPFVVRTAVVLSLPGPESVRLDVLDVTGRRVRALVDGPMSSGRHRVVWDGRNQEGVTVGGGVYFLRLEGAHFRESARVIRVHP